MTSKQTSANSIKKGPCARADSTQHLTSRREREHRQRHESAVAHPLERHGHRYLCRARTDGSPFATGRSLRPPHVQIGTVRQTLDHGVRQLRASHCAA